MSNIKYFKANVRSCPVRYLGICAVMGDAQKNSDAASRYR